MDFLKVKSPVIILRSIGADADSGLLAWQLAGDVDHEPISWLQLVSARPAVYQLDLLPLAVIGCKFLRLGQQRPCVKTVNSFLGSLHHVVVEFPRVRPEGIGHQALESWVTAGFFAWDAHLGTTAPTFLQHDATLSSCVCLSVCLSHDHIVSKQVNLGSRKQRQMIPQ